MHTLAGTTSTFFLPAFATCVGLLAIDKFLTQFSHTGAILYCIKISSGQIKLVARIVYNFVIG
jgi:hypothetical protein